MKGCKVNKIVICITEEQKMYLLKYDTSGLSAQKYKN